MFKIYPYMSGSESVKKLKDAIDATVIKLKNSRYVYRPGHVVVNWGNSRIPTWYTDNTHILNTPNAVASASNKLMALTALEEAGVEHVPFTIDKEEVEEWFEDGATKVYARKVLNGHSGEGIEVIKSHPDVFELDKIALQLRLLGYNDEAERVERRTIGLFPEIPDAPLYTKGIENRGEYRVHVFLGRVILYTKKSRRVQDGEVDTPEENEADVRNLDTGWVYRADNLNRLERVETLAIRAIDALGLDFGAVDIIMDQDKNVYVLEINTAPGMEERTLKAYADALKDYKEFCEE